MKKAENVLSTGKYQFRKRLRSPPTLGRAGAYLRPRNLLRPELPWEPPGLAAGRGGGGRSLGRGPHRGRRPWWQMSGMAFVSPPQPLTPRLTPHSGLRGVAPPYHSAPARPGAQASGSRGVDGPGRPALPPHRPTARTPSLALVLQTHLQGHVSPRLPDPGPQGRATPCPTHPLLLAHKLRLVFIFLMVE